MAGSEGEERNLTGIPRAHAEAAKELATFGTTVVTEVGSLARYIGAILGTAPGDAVGIVLGEPLHAVRTVIAAALHTKVQRILERWGVTETQPVSPSVAIPLIRAAYDEGRSELQDLWATLIAAAMSPTKAGRIRLSFIETLKQFDPLDALVLKSRWMAPPGTLTPNVAQFLLPRVGVGVQLDELMLSVENLQRLNCISWPRPGDQVNFHVTRYGAALLRAVSDG